MNHASNSANALPSGRTFLSVVVAFPEIAFRVYLCGFIRIRKYGSDICQLERVNQFLAIGVRLNEVLVGVDEKHRRRRIDRRDEMEQRRRFSAER